MVSDRWVEVPVGPEVIAGRERFGAHLRSRRGQLTRAAIADTAGLARSYMTELEQGKKSPREPTVRRLASALAALGVGDADELHRGMLEVLGPALAEPSRDPARVEHNRDLRLVRKARRRRKQAKIEVEVGRQIFPLADRIARVHATGRLELARDARRLDEKLSRLRETVREAERRRGPGSWADGAPMGTGSQEERRWQRDIIREAEERFGRRRVDEEVRMAAKRAEAEALERRMVTADEISEAQQAAAERREAREAERFGVAVELLEGDDQCY
jgi:transcriptional regulator with XRE-family HTH domain